MSDVLKETMDKALRMFKRLEGKVDFLLKRLGFDRDYDEVVKYVKELERKKRMEMARINSHDFKLVDEAREYYQKNNKKIPKDRLVLYYKDGIPKWVII